MQQLPFRVFLDQKPYRLTDLSKLTQLQPIDHYKIATRPFNNGCDQEKQETIASIRFMLHSDKSAKRVQVIQHVIDSMNSPDPDNDNVKKELREMIEVLAKNRVFSAQELGMLNAKFAQPE